MKYITALIFICHIFFSCDDALLGPKEVVDPQRNMELPPALDDGIEVSSPTKEGLDSARLFEWVADLQENDTDAIRSVLIAKNNRLVLEAYFDGWHRDRKQDMRSASKSFVSAVMGIALEKGVVKSIDEKILGFFPEYDSYLKWDDRKAEMRIRDFLRMRTGLSCNDWVEYSPGNQEKMYVTDDWIKFILDLPVVHDPGERFSYCSGAPIVLSAIINKTSGTTNFQFADENLFAPLGITDYAWEYMPPRPDYAGGQLHMRPRDALKFGLLFLNDGVWNERRVVSANWVEESTKPNGAVPGQRQGVGYGYLWWTTSWTIDGVEIPAYYANGNGGQVMYVLKDLDMVVLFTGGAYNTNAEATLYGIMRNSILPALVQ